MAAGLSVQFYYELEGLARAACGNSTKGSPDCNSVVNSATPSTTYSDVAQLNHHSSFSISTSRYDLS